MFRISIQRQFCPRQETSIRRTYSNWKKKLSLYRRWFGPAGRGRTSEAFYGWLVKIVSTAVCRRFARLGS